ncbi:MAG: 1-deoxy-D-xylulose-5-phosphate reductoisomerase [Armatimonadetes bacterium]|nr:1-deoxy-D-xylulose-5-phosphate reductoisomerase [Armatimonadota bacterium]
MKNVALLGSTGSIGTQVLDVVSRLPERLKVVSLAAHRNVELLADQVRKFRPSVVSIGSKQDADRLRELLADVPGLESVRGGSAVRRGGSPSPPGGSAGASRSPSVPDAGRWTLDVLDGAEGLARAATVPEADVVVVAVAGTVGLAPTIAAISAGKDIALASKEVLVAAGSIVSRMIQEKGVQLLPIDSEHSAIFQCLRGSEDVSKVRRILLTSSGGAFRDYPLEKLRDVTIEQALAHPTWNMGRKITVDSATMMNKGLEIIEAKWLFGVDPSRIEVVIHPQSIVHSMVLAQMGVPDMRTPIQYALLYPERVDTGLPRLDITAQEKLTFARPDPTRYPALELAYRAAEQGGTLPAVMNAANEVAVRQFLDGKIGFLDIQRTVRKVMEKHSPTQSPDLHQILEADSWARETTMHFTEGSID